MDHLYPVRPLFDEINDTLLQAPTEGQIWHNKSNNHLYIWEGSEWIPLSNRADYAANWGQIAHGQQIPKPETPDGYVFEYHECIWSTSPASIGKYDAFLCFADENGIVTVQYRPVGTSDFVDGIANYIIVGIRGNRNRGVTIPPPVPSVTPSPTPAPGISPTPTPTASPSVTPATTVTPTPSFGATLTATPTVTPTKSLTPTPTRTVTPTPSAIAPMTVVIDDPESGSSAGLLSAICNLANYGSGNQDSGYLSCGASSLSLCSTTTCAPEPGDNGVGPVMRVTVTGGVPPYTVKLKNFTLSTAYNIINPGFESGNTGWTKINSYHTGSSIWRIVNTSAEGPGSQSGIWYGELQDGYLGSDVIHNDTRAPVVPGETITASCGVNQWGNDAGEAGGQIRIVFFDSSNVEISHVNGNMVNSTSNGNWGTSTVTNAVVPVGAAFATVGIYLFRQSGASVHVTCDNFTWSLSTSGTAECFFVGGQNVPSFPTPGVVKTYSLPSSGSSTPIISLNGICASQLFLARGGFDILVEDSNGASQTFSKLWKNERISSGGDPGGGGGCVTCDSVIYGYAAASNVMVGDEMTVIDPLTYELGSGMVSKALVEIQPCVRITSESGIVLECSTTAPIADEFGNQILAPNLYGVRVPVYDNGEIRLEKVISVEDIGDKKVVNITCENNFFLAGAEENKYFLHHNAKNFE